MQQANGVYVVHRQLDGEWVRKSYRRNELVDALEDETMSPKTTDLLEDVKGLTHAKSGNTHVIKGILDMNLSEFPKKENLIFKINKKYSRFTMTVNEKSYALESFKGNVIGTVREGAARGKMKMDIDIKVDKSTPSACHSLKKPKTPRRETLSTADQIRRRTPSATRRMHKTTWGGSDSRAPRNATSDISERKAALRGRQCAAFPAQVDSSARSRRCDPLEASAGAMRAG